MNGEYYGFLLLGTAALGMMLLLIGAIVPGSSKRSLSDWVMIGGMGISFLAILGLIVLIVLESTSRWAPYPTRNYEFWQQILMAIGFAIPGGLVVFAGGFLLSRFEARRQAAQLELFTQGMQPHPGALPPGTGIPR